jgi:hypothetical protein
MTAQMAPAGFVIAETLIDSDVPLFELDDAPHTAVPHVRVRRGDTISPTLAATIEQFPFNEFGFSSGLDGAGRIVVVWRRVGTAVVSTSCDEVVIYADPAATERRLSHLVVDHVLPRVLWARGRTVFHATCVAIDGRAVGFVAASGGGKSTLAASLALQGSPLLSDDCLVLDRTATGFDVVPSYAGGRLRSDSVDGLALASTRLGQSSGHKFAVRFDRDAGVARYPLRALVAIDRQTDPSAPPCPIAAERVAAGDAFWLLGQRAFLTGNDARAFAALADVADCVPVWSLRYPSSYTVLEEVRDAVRSIVEGG